ncbi:MAG: HAD family phosphatase [Coriobacteriales bacterium]|jgi:HAD superfamily hydrolase (TIGR01509 family)|nr:HAD family phosphatase [Coriobacteriales bacterium]
MKKIHACIFDLDGTLFDSTAMWAQVDKDFLAKRGFAVPSDYRAHIATMSFAEASAYTVKRFQLKEDPAALCEEWFAMVEQAYAERIELKAGAGAYLRTLKAAGAKLAVATSSTPRLYRVALEHLQIAGLFDYVASADQVGVGKERPDVYLFAAARLGIKPEHCLVYEDMLKGLCSAKAAGMVTAAVLDEASMTDWEALRREADLSFCDYANAPNLAALGLLPVKA